MYFIWPFLVSGVSFLMISLALDTNSFGSYSAVWGEAFFFMNVFFSMLGTVRLILPNSKKVQVLAGLSLVLAIALVPAINTAVFLGVTAVAAALACLTPLLVILAIIIGWIFYIRPLLFGR